MAIHRKLTNDINLLNLKIKSFIKTFFYIVIIRLTTITILDNMKINFNICLSIGY